MEGVLVTGLIVHTGLPIPLAILLVLGGRRAGRPGQRADRHQGAGQFGHRHARHGHDHRRPQLRLFQRRADRRRRARGLPRDFPRPLLRHPEQRHRHGGRAAASSGCWSSAPRSARRSRRSAAIRRRRGSAGINVDGIKILGFVISGVCAALTGILLASRLGSGTTSAADSYLLTAFAAVFLGSATLARRRVPCLRHLHRRADHRGRLQRPGHLRRADLLRNSSSRARS